MLSERRFRYKCYVVTLLAALAIVSTARAEEPYASFNTPDKAAYCKVLVDITGEPENYFTPILLCWTPNDGFTVELSATGRAHTSTERNRRWSYQPSARRLRFGQDWWANSNGYQGTGTGRGEVLYRCRSRASGLTCENRARHGFWLGRFRGYRLF